MGMQNPWKELKSRSELEEGRISEFKDIYVYIHTHTHTHTYISGKAIFKKLRWNKNIPNKNCC